MRVKFYTLRVLLWVFVIYKQLILFLIQYGSCPVFNTEHKDTHY